MSELYADVQAHAEHLFDLYWTNGRVYDRLPKADRKRILDDYNDLYEFYLFHADE